jgi:hypothetical protein
MSTMIGVTLSVLFLLTMIMLFTAYAFKSRKFCFKFRKSGFADETDTQNFRINYPDHFISPPISIPDTLPDHETDDQVIN